MDEATFEANVLGLFACFNTPDAPSAAPVVLGQPKVPNPSAAAPSDAAAAPTAAPAAPVDAPIDRSALLKALFDALDTQKKGSIDVDEFLAQAKTSAEAEELRTLFHFFDSTLGAKSQQLTFEVFLKGTLEKTPLGRLRDAAFASAIQYTNSSAPKMETSWTRIAAAAERTRSKIMFTKCANKTRPSRRNLVTGAKLISEGKRLLDLWTTASRIAALKTHRLVPFVKRRTFPGYASLSLKRCAKRPVSSGAQMIRTMKYLEKWKAEDFWQCR